MPNSEKILVVEDEATISRILSTVLTANGYQVLNAENGQQALSMASSLSRSHSARSWTAGHGWH